MKKLKFETKFVADILSGKKVSTWRLFDDKDLQQGDELIFINKETGQEFAQASIIEVKETGLDVVSDEDMKEHGYENKEKMYEAYRKYYGLKVTPSSILKVVEFKIK